MSKFSKEMHGLNLKELEKKETELKDLLLQRNSLHIHVPMKKVRKMLAVVKTIIKEKEA